MSRIVLAPEIFGPDRDPPTTPTEALMRAAPEDEIERSTMERSHPIEKAIEQAFSSFDDLERDILVMKLMSQMTLRQISELTGLSKSEIHRRLPALTRRLQEALSENPEVLKYINGG